MLTKAAITQVDAGPVYTALIIEHQALAREAKPGQFLHIKCEGFSLRRPISIGDIQGDCLTIVFETKGGGTRWLSERKPGDVLDILGPLGNGFPAVDGPILLVGGGVGVPPMHCCARFFPECDSVLAFRSQDRALLVEKTAKLCGKTLVMSDDGSLGTKGFAAQGVQEMLRKKQYAAVFACGPKIMLKTTFEVCRAAGVPCWVSLEERMGCGLGACLTCATPVYLPGGEIGMKEVCKDGPVFSGEEVVWNG